MKKGILILLLFASVIIEARICSRGCVVSYNGMAYGYAWVLQPGETCSNGPQSGQQVAFAIVSPDYSGGGKNMLVDQGFIEDYTVSQMAC